MFIITYEENFAVGKSLEEALENYNGDYDELSIRDLEEYATWYEATKLQIEIKTSIVTKNIPTPLQGKKK